MDLIFKRLPIKNILSPNFIMHPLELQDYIDFPVKRFYFITNPQHDSSEHCHKIEKELFILLAGSCLAIIDQGNGRTELGLDGPSDALYVGNYVWHGFKNFSADAILMALSSTNYATDRSDYISDYEQYRQLINAEQQ